MRKRINTMTLKVKHWLYAIFCLLVVGTVLNHRVHTLRAQKARIARQAKIKRSRRQAAKQRAGVAQRNANMRTPINWRKSSETIPYPDLKQAKDLWVKVCLKKNRTYVYDGKHIIYTMYCTGRIYQRDDKTGKMKSLTPTGTYHIQNERGDHFYNAQLNEGANYYVSWLDHGKYLFHSVPTVGNGKYNKTEAAKLGKTQGSHGCVRLSVPDARWFSRNVPVGTKIVVTN